MAEQLCPRCKTPNRVSARFCANCGEPLLFNLQPKDAGSAAPEAGADETGQTAENEVVLAGRYRVDRELGRGGFGAVYEALDMNLNRRCAVKENLDASLDAFRQFGREASILANLSHPNLPRVTDHFAIPNKGQYLVMDYVDGEDLEKLLKHAGPIAADQALFWIFQVIDALEYLHDQQQPIIHRDIKPANIRVTPRGQAVLVDFGLVKLYDPKNHTTLGARAVTPGFAPPEQYGTGKTDVRSDIYALGATLYTILTGTEPLESVQRIQGGKQPQAHQLLPTISPELSRVIEKSMALNPADRFQTVVLFKNALQAARETPATISEALVAPQANIATARVTENPSRPTSQPRPATAPHPRNRALPTAGVAVLVVLCTVMLAVVGSLAYYDSLAPARITLTVQGQQTLSAQIFATQTAQKRLISGGQATQEPGAQSSPFLPMQLPALPPKFSEDFDAPNTSFWTGEDNNHLEFEHVTARLQNNAYHLELRGAKRTNAFWWTTSPELQLAETFILSLRSRVTAGAGKAMVGMIFRLDREKNLFYLFGVNGQQQFGVWKVQNNEFTVLQEPQKNNAITTHWNDLILWAENGRYRFFINEVPVAELLDASLTGNQAGMYYAVGDNVSATFETDNVLLKTP